MLLVKIIDVLADFWSQPVGQAGSACGGFTSTAFVVVCDHIAAVGHALQVAGAERDMDAIAQLQGVQASPKTECAGIPLNPPVRGVYGPCIHAEFSLCGDLSRQVLFPAFTVNHLQADQRLSDIHRNA